MNGEDSFESRLKSQPQRKIPAAWRNEILRAARVPEPSRFSPLKTLFWPHPKAWAALAAVWLVVLGLNFSQRETPTLAVAYYSTVPSSLVREMLRQQEQMFAELVGVAEKPMLLPPAPLPAQPRSQRREEYRYV